MTESGGLSQNSDKVSIKEVVVVLVLSFVSVVIIVLLFSRLFRCVLEYRMDEARVALVGGLVTGVVMSFTKIVTDRVQKLLRCIFGGIALALLLCLLVVAFLPPLPKSDCTYLFAPTPVPPTATPSPSPTSVSSEEPIVEPTEEPTEEPTVEPTEEPTEEPTVEPAEEPTLEPTEEPTTIEPLTGKIAFPVYQGEQKYIYLAELDGVEPTLKKLVGDASEPAISPNGSEIAFRSWDASYRGLMVMNIDGTNPRKISRNLEDACPYWAQGESLVFHSTKEGPTPRLYTVGTWAGAENVDSVRGVKPDKDPAYGRYPAWVPDGRIVYKYFDRSGDFFGLYIMNLDGSNPMPITDHPGDTMPSVSSGGERVAFMSDRNRSGYWEVYVVNIDGSELKQLTDSGDHNSGLPTWSPDGRYIAFVSDRDNQWAIWVINYDGSGERKLFDLDGTLIWAERISWAP